MKGVVKGHGENCERSREQGLPNRGSLINGFRVKTFFFKCAEENISAEMRMNLVCSVMQSP